MTDLELLNEFIRRDAGGGRVNVSRTAREKLLRSPATVRRWLKRESPIPAVVTRELQRQLLVDGKVKRVRLKKRAIVEDAELV